MSYQNLVLLLTSVGLLASCTSMHTIPEKPQNISYPQHTGGVSKPTPSLTSGTTVTPDSPAKPNQSKKDEHTSQKKSFTYDWSGLDRTIVTRPLNYNECVQKGGEIDTGDSQYRMKKICTF